MPGAFSSIFEVKKKVPDIAQREEEMPGALEHTVEITERAKSELSKSCAIC